jgi:hypothetical protein
MKICLEPPPLRERGSGWGRVVDDDDLAHAAFLVDLVNLRVGD